MSRGSRPPRRSGTDEPGTTVAVCSFLRALADRVESDPAFAAQVHAALRESGLLASGPAPAVATEAAARRPGRASAGAAAPVASSALDTLLPDPFAVLRERGEAGLRAALDALDLASLRQLVRTHRLDPARISARWSARDRVIALIVDQVRARADHGKAFSRV